LYYFFEFLILLWDNFPINIFDNLHFINYFIEDLFKLSQKKLRNDNNEDGAKQRSILRSLLCWTQRKGL
jgi:hypothetical protein